MITQSLLMPGLSYKTSESSMLLQKKTKLLLVTCLHWSASAKVILKHEIPLSNLLIDLKKYVMYAD